MPTFDPTIDQVREFHTRAVADDEHREIAGIGVPLGEQIEVWPGFREEFAAECEFVGIERSKLMQGHRELIGVIASHKRERDQLSIVGKVSKTRAGDDALELARDGALDSFSIGFRPIEWTERDVDGEISVVYTKVLTREFSLTPIPAYENALVTEVRHRPASDTERPNMPPTDALTREDLDSALDERIEDFERNFDARLAQLNTGEQSPIGSQWRSAGEFIKALAAGDEAAIEFHRAYTGGTLADGAPASAWVKDAIKLVDRGRPVLNLFQRATLPAAGNTLEWYQLLADTTAVQKQLAEGDDLPFGKVELERKTTNVETYGGYTELTRQAIERSTAPLMSTAHQALALAYGRATEAAVRAYLFAALAAQAAAGNKLERAAGDIALLDNAAWLDLIVDGADLFEERGFAIEGMLVAKDVFKQLYRLEDGAGHNLMNVYGTGVNQSGSINATKLSGNLANVPVRILPGAPAGTVSFYDPQALVTYESPGAPLQLQDENIINLSKAFSVYGYLAPALPFPGALLPVVAAAV